MPGESYKLARTLAQLCEFSKFPEASSPNLLKDERRYEGATPSSCLDFYSFTFWEWMTPSS